MLKKETGIDDKELQAAINANENYSILQRGILSGDIALVNTQNKPVFRKSLTLIGEKGKRAVNESPNFEDEHEDEVCEPEQARLVSNIFLFNPLSPLQRMQPSVISEISAGVHDYVRRNS